MAQKTQADDAAARVIAEKASPGWKAVEVSRSTAPVSANADESDVRGVDLATLKTNYLGYATDNVAKPAARRRDDAQYVTMAPLASSDSPIQTRKVIVSGKKVVGFQG